MDTAKLIRKLGGPSFVGGVCGISRQAVIQWPRIPAEYVIRLFRARREVTPHEMRRDLYPHKLDGTRTNGKRRA